MSVANFMIKRVPASYELKPLMKYNPSQPPILISMLRLTAAINSEARFEKYLTSISLQELEGLLEPVQKETITKKIPNNPKSKIHTRPTPFTPTNPFQQMQPLIIVDVLGKKQILDGKRRATQILKDGQTAAGVIGAYVIPSFIAEEFMFGGFKVKVAKKGALSQFERIKWKDVHPTLKVNKYKKPSIVEGTVDFRFRSYSKMFQWVLKKKVGLTKTNSFTYYKIIQKLFDIFSVHCIFRIAGILNADDIYNTENGNHLPWAFLDVVRAIEFNKKEDHHPEKRQIKPELIRFINYRDFVNLNDGNNFYFKSLADSTIRRDKLRAKLYMKKLVGFMSTELGEAEIINRYTALSKRRNNSVSEHLSGSDYALQLARATSLFAYINTAKRRVAGFTSNSSEITHSVRYGMKRLYRPIKNQIVGRHEDIKYHQIKSLDHDHEDYLSFDMLFDLMRVFRIDLSFLSMDCPNLKPVLELLAMVVVDGNFRPTVLTPVTANHFLTYQAIRERGEIDRYWDCMKKVVDEMMTVISLDQLISDASEVVATGQAKTLNLSVYNWNAASQAGFIFAHDETQMIEIDPATGYNGDPAIETDLNVVVSELSYQRQKSLSKQALNDFPSVAVLLGQAVIKRFPDRYAALSK